MVITQSNQNRFIYNKMYTKRKEKQGNLVIMTFTGDLPCDHDIYR